MRRLRRPLAWTLVALLFFAPLLVPHSEVPARRPSSIAWRLLGPVASLAASVQWVRVHDAMRAGRTDLALARARTALALDPGATAGWVFLATHLVFDRASAERERDPGRRMAWIRAGLETAERGEDTARDPGELARWQGLVLGMLAQEDEPLAWPGGVRRLWLDAADDFERASRLGQADAAELARRARGNAEAGR